MNKRILMITILALTCMTAGCGKEKETEQVPETQIIPDTEQKTEVPEETQKAADSTSEAGFSFSDVADREFYFSSGAGGWYTVLHIHEDGSFDGHYQDSDMGVADPDSYPNGTVYYSDFSGSFTEPEKIDSTTYAFQIGSIEYPLGFEDEIRDGCHYCYTTAYGLDGAEDLFMYLPGTPLADLPEAYRSWVGYYDLEAVSDTGLTFYGLYNVEMENGFSSYVMPDDADRIAAEIAQAEETAAELEDSLQNALTQADMNVISGEIYETWDSTLNTIWGILKDNLDDTSMQALTEEERRWITEKEKAVQEAGAEYEDGSLYTLAVNQKAAELTRERVYELQKYLQ